MNNVADDVRPPPPAEITFPASTFFNVSAIEQMMNNRCERAIWPLVGQISALEKEIENERSRTAYLQQALEVQKLEIEAEKEARAKADAHVLTLFPPIAEQMMAHEQAISDALARSNTIAFAVDEVREMVLTKAEKTSVDQVRRDLDIECETSAARDVNTNKRIDAVDRELPKKISHRECKELVTEVDARLADAIDVVAKEADEAVKKVEVDLEEQGTFLSQKIDQVKVTIPPIIVKHDALQAFVDTLPPKIEELELQSRTMKGELEDTMQRLSDAKLQIEQVNKMVIKERAKEAAGGNSVEKLAEEIERLKSLRDEIQA